MRRIKPLTPKLMLLEADPERYRVHVRLKLMFMVFLEDALLLPESFSYYFYCDYAGKNYDYSTLLLLYLSPLKYLSFYSEVLKFIKVYIFFFLKAEIILCNTKEDSH